MIDEFCFWVKSPFYPPIRIYRKMKKSQLIALLIAPAIAFSQEKKQLQDSIKDDSYGTLMGWRIKKGDRSRQHAGSQICFYLP
ncbi:MAG TPA: hypothetical protein VK625_20950 [Flavitalea sp.]|nr:hypothetical protein [Mucilaginibacter sp.]HTF31344.1 hypothetical protein [Flavitalea sp.]